MRFIALILALLFATSTTLSAQERIELLYAGKTFQIYHIVEDHFDMVHFEGDMDIMSSFYLFTALEYTQSNYLSMNSNGGYMNEAYILGNFLKTTPNITFVVRNDNICVSACAFAALSAKKLMIGQNGLDFHSPYIPYVDSFTTLHEFSKESQQSMLTLIKYLDEVGYGYEFLSLMLEYTSPSDFVTFYSVNDLEYYKVKNFFDKVEHVEPGIKYKLNTR